MKPVSTTLASPKDNRLTGSARQIKSNSTQMKQRTITFVIILLVFLSIFSANYELLNKIRSSEIIHSKILKSSSEETSGTQKGICEAPASANAMNFIESATMEIISANF